eukprot:1153447-Pelagomonas_calceolata.AAC.7
MQHQVSKVPPYKRPSTYGNTFKTAGVPWNLSLHGHASGEATFSYLVEAEFPLSTKFYSFKAIQGGGYFGQGH